MANTTNETAKDDTASKFLVRRPPTFDSVDEHREHVKQRLAGICRIFGKLGFGEGLLGHITARDPGDPHRFWVNPLGRSFNLMRVSDLVQADHEGNVVSGDGAVNPVGLLLHTALHVARPDVAAVCHAHSTYGSTWSAFGRPIDPITQDLCVFHDDQAIIRDPRVARNADEAEQFAAAFGDKRVGIQVGHGIFTTGHTIDEAAWWFVCLDKAAHVQLLASAAGEYETWPAPAAQGVKRGIGSPDFGWLSFQTLWDEVVLSDPDLFD